MMHSRCLKFLSTSNNSTQLKKLSLLAIILFLNIVVQFLKLEIKILAGKYKNLFRKDFLVQYNPKYEAGLCTFSLKSLGFRHLELNVLLRFKITDFFVVLNLFALIFSCFIRCNLSQAHSI